MILLKGATSNEVIHAVRLGEEVVPVATTPGVPMKLISHKKKGKPF